MKMLVKEKNGYAMSVFDSRVFIRSLFDFVRKILQIIALNLAKLMQMLVKKRLVMLISGDHKAPVSGQ